MGDQLELTVRAATVADVDEVVRLAELMFDAVGYDIADTSWLTPARDVLRERLGEDAMAVVVDHPAADGRLIASGAGTITRRLPVPTNPSARVGYVQWVATDPQWRGRGLARAVMTDLLRWFTAREVTVVELHTSKFGERMYRAMGFAESPHPGLRLHLDA